VANSELARATRLKDEFLANMSHELRTPLNAVLGMSEGLMTGVFGDLNERQMRSLSLIETSGRHLLELINDILDVAKIGAGKLELELSSVGIEYLCKSSLNFVKQIANQKNIQLKLSINHSIKMITVDERRMRQALINLLSNAVKFTPKGGKICLEVKLQEREATELTSECSYAMIFSIIDTGIGISSEDISNLFQAFVQIDSSLNRQYAGTGLGLTLVKQLVEMHGGCVSVASQVGEGSSFSIVLPYRESIELDKLDKAEPPSNSFGEGYNQVSNLENNLAVNPLILMADDNPINIETFSNYLTSRGYRLIFASDGQEAINMTIAQNPDLILMDIQMPVLDGISAIESIRANPDINNIPIVALTALAMIGDREKCLAVGANEYLAKPVQLSHLVTVIQKQLLKTT
jgi:CheY-like chemotaxis protein/nitrogen-specific signal transduction histidine kinase